MYQILTAFNGKYIADLVQKPLLFFYGIAQAVNNKSVYMSSFFSDGFLVQFSIHYLEGFHLTHLNAEKYFRKLWLNVYLLLFQRNNMLVKWKLNIKSLGKKCQALKDFDSALSNQEVAKKYGALNTVFYRIFKSMKDKDFDFFLLSQTFTISNFFISPMEVCDSSCRLYVFVCSWIKNKSWI